MAAAGPNRFAWNAVLKMSTGSTSVALMGPPRVMTATC